MKKILLAAALLAVPFAALAEKAPELVSGYRAMSVPVSASQLRFLEPGDRVDILAGFDAELSDKKKEYVVATIMQNVRVLALDRKEGLASLELNPNESQYVAVFADKSLWLVKRREDDKKMEPREMAAARKLFR